jgi:hypothetical protein
VIASVILVKTTRLILSAPRYVINSECSECAITFFARSPSLFKIAVVRFAEGEYESIVFISISTAQKARRKIDKK